MVKELYIIRHGQAGKALENKKQDEKRPLKKQGKKTIKKIAKGLKELKVDLDIVLASPLPRSEETARIISEHCTETQKVEVTDLLKPGASPKALVDFLNKHRGSKKIAVVGHEPFLSEFASYCLSRSKNGFINLKKGGVIMLEANTATIKPGECKLRWLIEPKHITKS